MNPPSKWELHSKIAHCDLCTIGRDSAGVPGEGPIPAQVMIVGRNPGRQEAKQGKPFVGSAGKRLNTLLLLAGLDRKDLYVTNLVKHFTPNNRKPYKAEIVACSPFLEAELALAKPALILALGDEASKWFLPGIKLAKEHGIPHETQWGLVVPMYHPAATLHTPNLLPIVAQDFNRLKTGIEVQPGELVYSLGTDEQISQLPLHGYIGFDVETTSPKRGKWFIPFEARIVGYSIATDKVAIYAPSPPEHFKNVLEDGRVVKICHNAKFEYGRLKQAGIQLNNFRCTKLAAYLLREHSTHLKILAAQVLGRQPTTYEEVTQGRDMSELSPEEIYNYACADSDNALSLWNIFETKLKLENLDDLYYNVELPLIPVLSDMEETGVAIDRPYTKKLGETFLKTIDDWKKLIEAFLPPGTNINSHDQLSAALEKLEAPIKEMTGVKRQLKVDKANLQSIKEWSPVLIGAVLAVKHTAKLYSYLSNFLQLCCNDGRIHPSWQQAGTYEEVSDDSLTAPLTGRLSSSGPNLQNLPHRLYEGESEEGALFCQVRKCIVPEEGWVFVSADIQQEEPRIAALVAPEPQMMADFEAGIPVYTPLGEAIFGHPISKADVREWFIAKTFFLALLYGARDTKLHEIDQTISLQVSKGGYNRVIRRYPGLVLFRKRVEAEAMEKGYVTDWFGRRRSVYKVYSTDPRIVAEGLREAINFHVSGPAATVLKMAMLRVHSSLRSMKARLCLSIHDEVVVETPQEELAEVVSILRNMTKNILPISLPVDISVGKNLGEMRRLDDKE